MAMDIQIDGWGLEPGYQLNHTDVGPYWDSDYRSLREAVCVFSPLNGFVTNPSRIQRN